MCRHIPQQSEVDRFLKKYTNKSLTYNMTSDTNRVINQ